MSSFSKLFSRRPTSPPKERRPFARRLSRYEPRVFRGEEAVDLSPTDVLPEYKPPSLLTQHKGVTIVFAILCVALAAYWIKSLRAARNAPPPVQSVYIDMLPQTPPPQERNPGTR